MVAQDCATPMPSSLPLANPTAPPARAGELAGLLEKIDPQVLNYLRYLLNSQPTLRTDWETWDFFQELSSRYLLRISSKRNAPAVDGNHEVALLKRLAKHLFVDQMRRLRARKRDVLRIQGFPQGSLEPASSGDSSQLDRMVRQETLERVRKQLTEDEWEILRLHAEGHGWVEMATMLDRKPSAVRMQFNRLMARLAETLKA